PGARRRAGRPWPLRAGPQVLMPGLATPGSPRSAGGCSGAALCSVCGGGGGVLPEPVEPGAPPCAGGLNWCTAGCAAPGCEGPGCANSVCAAPGCEGPGCASSVCAAPGCDSPGCTGPGCTAPGAAPCAPT